MAIEYIPKRTTGTTEEESSSSAAPIDHGDLTGLGDDDHTQYMKAEPATTMSDSELVLWDGQTGRDVKPGGITVDANNLTLNAVGLVASGTSTLNTVNVTSVNVGSLDVSGDATIPSVTGAVSCDDALTAESLECTLDLTVGQDITISGFVDGVDVGSPKNSIEVDSNEYQLVGDASAPGNEMYYGTDDKGAKGFYSLPVAANTTILTCGSTNASSGNMYMLWGANAADAGIGGYCQVGFGLGTWTLVGWSVTYEVTSFTSGFPVLTIYTLNPGVVLNTDTINLSSPGGTGMAFENGTVTAGTIDVDSDYYLGIMLDMNASGSMTVDDVVVTTIWERTA